MSFKIAVTGKGGVGKTTLAAFLVEYISDRYSKNLLAVDADPNSNLSEALGLKQPESIADIIEYAKKHMNDIPAGTSKERFLEYRVHESVEETKGFDLLVMGRPHGLGCYCYVNNVLTDIMSKLIRDYQYLVVDNEAGMEHLSRRTLEDIDTLFIVSDYSVVGVRTAIRIARLAESLDIKVGERYLVINKVRGDIGDLKRMADTEKLALGGVISYNDAIAKLSLEGRPLDTASIDSGLSGQLESLCSRILTKARA